MKAIIRRKPKALFHIVGSQLSSQLLFYSTHAQADKHDLLPKQHHSSFWTRVPPECLQKCTSE